MNSKDVISVSTAGQLTTSGHLANSAEDVLELFVDRIPRRTVNWKRVPVVLYIHGGLVDEKEAVDQANEFWNRCFPVEIYPISIIWHTDYWSTVVRSMVSPSAIRRLAHWFSGPSEAANQNGTEDLQGMQGTSIFNYSNSLIEIIARYGTGKLTWDDIKRDAFLASESTEGATRTIVAGLQSLLLQHSDSAEIHVVAHSAGAVFAAPFLRVLTSHCFVASCTLWAPACTCDLFEQFYVPLLAGNKLGNLNLFTLSPEAELADEILHLYRKSTLYLISNAYERALAPSCGSAPGEPLLGMTRFLEEYLKQEEVGGQLLATHKIRWAVAPNDFPLGAPDASRARGHLDFPRDDATLRATMACILGARR